MSEIRFLAWDPRTKMIYSPHTPGKPWYEMHVEPYSKLMRYTGVEGKNDYIYEGFIAKCPYCSAHNLMVVYNAPQFRLKSVGGEACANAHLVRIDGWLEIIGNAFENPELLRKEEV